MPLVVSLRHDNPAQYATPLSPADATLNHSTKVSRTGKEVADRDRVRGKVCADLVYAAPNYTATHAPQKDVRAGITPEEEDGARLSTSHLR